MFFQVYISFQYNLLKSNKRLIIKLKRATYNSLLLLEILMQMITRWILSVYGVCQELIQ